MIHHVQVSCPVGGEDRQRAFYSGVLGWIELPKPPLLAARGECWFRVPGVTGPDGRLGRVRYACADRSLVVPSAFAGVLRCIRVPAGIGSAPVR